MSTNQSDLITQQEISQLFEEQLIQFHTLRQQKITPITRPPKRNLLKNLKKFPLIALIFKAISSSSSFALSVRIWQGIKDSPLLHASLSLSLIAVLVDLINFLRTPFLLITAKLLGLEAPLTLSKASKWLYSSFILILGILLVATPQFSVVILIAMMSLAIIDSSFLLSKLLYNRHKQENCLKQTNTSYLLTYKELLDIEQKIESLQASLPSLNHLRELLEIYVEKRKILQQIITTQAEALRIIHKNDALRLTDRLMMLLFSSIGLLAAIVSFSIPPLGFILFSLSSGLGALYLITRVVTELLWPAGNIEKDKEVMENLKEHLEKLANEKNDSPLSNSKQAFNSRKTAPKENTHSEFFGHRQDKKLATEFETDSTKSNGFC